MIGHGAGWMLLTAVAGYWVLERADTHKGELKRIGQAFGWVIILVSLVGMVCNIWCLAQSRVGYCPFTSSKTSPMPPSAPMP